MLTVMIFVFLIGYLCIALEHPLKVNKAGTALLTGTILWVLYTFAAPDLIPTASAEEFKEFLDAYPAIADLPFVEQCTRFVVEHQVLDSIGEIAETLIFLIGAMITVELTLTAVSCLSQTVSKPTRKKNYYYWSHLLLFSCLPYSIT